MFAKLQSKLLLTTFSAAFLFCTAASAQEVRDDAAAGTESALARALTNSGIAEATLVSAIRDGDTLMVNVRFKATDGASGSETLYTGLSEQNWKTDYFIVSGNKKYLLLKDSAGVPLAPSSLELKTSTPQAGSWSATFPAPPAGQEAILHIHNVEPLGPFTVPQ